MILALIPPLLQISERSELICKIPSSKPQIPKQVPNHQVPKTKTNFKLQDSNSKK